MTEKLPSFLGITPFGPYCTLCNESLSIQTGIWNHGKEKHPECIFKNAAIVREVQQRMSHLRSTHADDLSTFLTSERAKEPAWFCNGCFKKFSYKHCYERHFERSKACSLDLVGEGKPECYVTICGRIGPKSCRSTSPTCASTIVSHGTAVSTLTDSIFRSSTINNLLVVDYSTKVPATLLTTQEQASEILAPFVRPDEDVRDLCLIYYPLLSPGFDGMMRQFLSYSAPQAGEDGILFKWLEAGREWLANYAAGHIANVSANVRTRLAEFEQRELDGTTVGTRTFTLRRGIPRLMTELDAALRFFYRYPTTIFDSFKSKELLYSTKQSMIESAIIPKILFTAAAEEPDDHGRLPIACLYCLSRGFTTKGSSDLTMNECGAFASRISAVLHLLRAGVCGYLITLSVDNPSELLSLQEMEIVNRIQNGRVTNLLAPYVKRLRNMYSRKPPAKSNTVNSNGDITSGGFTFPQDVWSTIIPRVEEMSRACFDEVFESDNWKLFLEKPIRMTDWARLEASVLNNDSTILLRDIVVQRDKEPVLAKVQSILEFCFFGLGVGAVRHEEVLRLTVLSCQWHNSYLYFWTESFKRGSLKVSTTPKLVEHRLSLSLSRIVLLGRHALVSTSDDANPDSLFPVNSGASMLGLVQDLFDFDCPPQTLNVRHLFTSIGNVIFPETGPRGGDGCLVSASLLTEKSGHTQVTGRLAYGTWLENSEEAMYDLYHSRLGESSLHPPPLEFTPFSDFVLESSLKSLLGREATYRSDHQKQMIAFAANSILCHAFVGLPCGHGKSLSWLVPTLASYLSGRHVGLRIVILPYKFLLGHVVHSALTAFGLLRKKLVVAFLDSSQISQDHLPVELEEGHLPNLLFLNLDGAATLFRFHLNHLQNLASRGILKRLYLDEFQQFLVEYGFRSSYQSLQHIGRVGAPVMCLSGSLPTSMAKRLMSYCGLGNSPGAHGMDIVKPTDPIGDGFSFDVSVVDDIATSVVQYVLHSRVGACHVLCSSIALVDAISVGLSSKHLRVLSTTGDSPYHDQIACAKSWFRGGYDVLVSTVVALVGNENKECKTIVVAGFLFNVSSLVQAIGRLRPEQRGATSKVHVFRFPFRSGNRRDAKLQSEQLFDEIVQAGCLTEASRDLFVSLFTPVGLQEILLSKDGCYLQHLSRMYGFVRLPCDRCGLCLEKQSSPISAPSSNVMSTKRSCISGNNALTQTSPVSVPSSTKSCKPPPTKRLCTSSDNVLLGRQIGEEKNKDIKDLSRKAQWVFCELKYRCLSCGKSICNGECAGGCFRCGSRQHGYAGCKYDATYLAKVLPNKGVCFGCFDTRQHQMKAHDMKSCPYKRRLKRLVFLDHQKRGINFEEYLRRLYSSEVSFVSMVASFSDRTSLGR